MTPRITSEGRGRRDAAVVALAFCAGLRRSEIGLFVGGGSASAPRRTSNRPATSLQRPVERPPAPSAELLEKGERAIDEVIDVQWGGRRSRRSYR